MRHLIIAGLLCSGLPLPAFAEDTALLDRLDASRIVAISDGDFVGSTYADGVLAPEAAGHRDVLSVLTRSADGWIRAELELSNSVTAAPEILALDSTGRWAFVAERLAGRQAGDQTAADLSPGRRVFAVDLEDPAAPRLAFETEVMDFPEALAVSPDGRSIAVVGGSGDDARIDILPFGPDGFGTALRAELNTLGVDGALAPLAVTNVHWHPDGNRIAVNLNRQDSVALLEILPEGLRLIGTPAPTGTDPFVGRFAAGGRYYVTANWGRDFTAQTVTGRLPDRPSTLSVLAVEDSGLIALGRAETGESAEGIAVSPDGGLIATVNMDGTSLPGDRFSRFGTIGLFRLSDQGTLDPLGLYQLEGVLPEGGTFDATGRHFLATVFHGHEDATPDTGAGLEVFEVDPTAGPRGALTAVGRIVMPHGVHHVAIQP
ncbi:lactonase family protein [Frigidibacter oleivorans]|uniref:hypothetical protein n=1 Tax=Frigidibacter oleivorans TaxID=2487129 RepID=UPI000F8DF214|nr:hypothetical protein [Frigidibacter oleivorans]